MNLNSFPVVRLAMTFGKNLITRSIAAWDEFFFSRPSYLSIAIFRICLATNLFFMYAIRQLHWRFYFTSEGFLTNTQANELMPEAFRPLVNWFPSDPSAVLGLHTVFVLVLFFLIIGIGSRVWSWVALFLHLTFLNRNYSIGYGADIISCFMLFGLALMDCDRELSVVSYFKQKRRAKIKNAGKRSAARIQAQLRPLGSLRAMLSSLNELLSSVGVRLLQFQLCIIYGYTGLEKIKGAVWWDGSAVWEAFGNQQMNMIDLTWMSHFPLVIGLMTLTSMLFEIYFPVLIWGRRTRFLMLAFGCMLHMMIGLTLGLVFFSGAILSAYVLFIDGKAWKQLRSFKIITT